MEDEIVQCALYMRQVPLFLLLYLTMIILIYTKRHSHFKFHRFEFRYSERIGESETIFLAEKTLLLNKNGE